MAVGSLLAKNNPQCGSQSSSSGDNNSNSNTMHGSKTNRQLPPLFYYMEAGDWAKAFDRAKRHPREVKVWASIRSKADPQQHQEQKTNSSPGATISSSKRLALHHACFKLRISVCSNNHTHDANGFSKSSTDPFIEVCKFILLLLEMYPEAASKRESRHGCLPLHLAAFASCTLPFSPAPPTRAPAANAVTPAPALALNTIMSESLPMENSAPFAMSSMNSALPTLARPSPISNNKRSASNSSNATVVTTMTAGMVEETAAGNQTDFHKLTNSEEDIARRTKKGHRRGESAGSVNSDIAAAAIHVSESMMRPTMSVSLGNNILISEKREEWAVKVLNSLLDAHPKGIRMDSEGGRLPLHTACAGRATPRVVSTLLTAYPSAARHRNKDGFLPLHLSAHWGISHPNVVIALLKAYPDATFGRNRWERTPLEEALCMAGENGRPHQAALVRALRKHPSYWTRPIDLFESTSPRGLNNNIVDIDETLPSNDESTDDANLFGRMTPDHTDTLKNPQAPVDLVGMIRNQNWSGVISRLEMNPEEAEEDLKVMTRGGFTASTGFTPLHFAAERRPPVAVVEALISACPRAITTRAMPGGALPLHVACTWYAPIGVINALITADRNGCKTQDELGNLPLHSACFSGTSPQVFDVLLRAYPKATLARNHQGSLPDEISKRLKHDDRRTILSLLSSCKEQVLAKREKKYRNNRPDYPLHDTSIDSHVVTVTNPQNGLDEQELVWV